MKKIIVLSFSVILLIGCKNNQNESSSKKSNEQVEHKEDAKKERKTETKKKMLSPHTSVMAMIGDAHIHIDYSSPGVRNRIIFGGLVGYDNVWQAGAHMATWIETNKNLEIDGKILPAGKYGFFTIPSKKDWTIMINKNWNQHGKDEYDQKDDVLRFLVAPTISEKITEHLEYKVTNTKENEGSISLSWEKITVSFPIKINQ
ncbi:hypothetical protein MNBD_BACTEROID03-2124 [hydrothermal vent metagenome]|uniref:DUF2911 domain-containing protein n=1 Tax=hydrothermal vent metagenome TaxID=652676 RepID=A0A3B0T4R1_9ZZZZ